MAVTERALVEAHDPDITAAVALQQRLDPLKNALGLAELTDGEMSLFAMVAHRMRLDPFARQIHATKRKGRVTFQVGIDGFRGTAEETGEYRGSDEPEFGPIVDRPFAHPEWARVVVHRQYPGGDWLHQSATVWWDEFYPGEGENGFMWRKMPRNQLAKCAEAAGFRKAFPRTFGQVYEPAEMDQAAEARPVGDQVMTARERAAARREAIEARVVTDAAGTMPAPAGGPGPGGTTPAAPSTGGGDTPASPPVVPEAPGIAADGPCGELPPPDSPLGLTEPCGVPAASHGRLHKSGEGSWPLS